MTAFLWKLGLFNLTTNSRLWRQAALVGGACELPQSAYFVEKVDCKQSYAVIPFTYWIIDGDRHDGATAERSGEVLL
ncbi:hypothetical protein [Rhodoblastus sp.]|uniref:hypothetical protein n=1 Tax=Rhodoblastus sp. TaxID=1962975 RepID=UPI003F9C1681